MILSVLMGALVFFQGAPAANRVVVIGCIQRAWTITDFRGGPTPTYRLDANDSKLVPWVGYTVEITGTIVGPYGVTSKEQPLLKVEKVDRISRSCTALEPR